MLVLGTIMLTIAIAFCITLYICNEDDFTKIYVVFMLALSVAGSFIVSIEISDSSPKAIEVYQGKTTLEITYRDSIPVDSVVVYKK